jgi:mRNA interferase HigB
MRIIALKALRDFWEKHPQAEVPLRAWHAIASRAAWRSPADVKAAYRAASILGGKRVVFNIKANEFWLVVAVHYNRGLIYIRFVGTHQQYDRINAEDI